MTAWTLPLSLGWGWAVLGLLVGLVLGLQIGLAYCRHRWRKERPMSGNERVMRSVLSGPSYGEFIKSASYFQSPDAPRTSFLIVPPKQPPPS